MNSQRWQQIKHLLDAVLELRPEARDAFLTQHCGEDRTLRAEIEAFLADEAAVQTFIEQPLMHMLSDPPAKTPKPGEK